MQLAFLINNFYPFGGLEKNFLRIVHACLEKGHKIKIFTMSWEGEQPPGMEIELLPVKGLTNHGRAQSFVRLLSAVLENSNFDLIIGFNRMPGLDLYYAADVCYVIDINRRRGPLSKLTRRYHVYAEFERAVFGRNSSTHIMYLSEVEMENYISIYNTPKERFHYLPPGIDKERIRAAINPETRIRKRKELGLQEQDLMLLAIGSDFKRKGLSRSIVAIAALPEDVRKRTHLYIIGKGEMKKYQRQAKRAELEAHVHFLGVRKDVPFFLAAADILLHPAVTENTGNVILEAMVAGLPVLTTAICGYSFHVKRADAGYVVMEPFQQHEMNRRLRQMIDSPLLKKWGMNGYIYADKEDFYTRPLAAVKIIESLAMAKRIGKGL